MKTKICVLLIAVFAAILTGINTPTVAKPHRAVILTPQGTTAPAYSSPTDKANPIDLPNKTKLIAPITDKNELVEVTVDEGPMKGKKFWVDSTYVKARFQATRKVSWGFYVAVALSFGSLLTRFRNRGKTKFLLGLLSVALAAEIYGDVGAFDGTRGILVYALVGLIAMIGLVVVLAFTLYWTFKKSPEPNEPNEPMEPVEPAEPVDLDEFDEDDEDRFASWISNPRWASFADIEQTPESARFGKDVLEVLKSEVGDRNFAISNDAILVSLEKREAAYTATSMGGGVLAIEVHGLPEVHKRLRAKLVPLGCIVCYHGNGDNIVIVKDSDKYRPLKLMTYIAHLGAADIIDELNKWDTQYGLDLELIGFGTDFVQVEAHHLPTDLKKLCEEIVDFSDALEHESDPVPVMIEELRETKVIHLWWD